jgi:carboxymethylenebutenolidase
VHEFIKDICRRFARLGYVAIAPAFFVRVADPAPLTDFAEIRRLVSQATDPQVMGDIRAALAWLAGRPFVDRTRTAVTGFCWGGGETWLACEEFAQFRAGAAWYGRLARPPSQAASPNTYWPIERVASLHCPVLGLYAGRDQLTASVPAMREALAAAGKTGSEIVVYPNAQHGFLADYRPTYDANAARDGWTRMLIHFRTHGAAPGAA